MCKRWDDIAVQALSEILCKAHFNNDKNNNNNNNNNGIIDISFPLHRLRIGLHLLA